MSQNNLILNPSCEEATQIPDNIAQYDFCIDWWQPYIYSTDYFTSLTLEGNNNFIPNNILGNQPNFDGFFYLGIVVTNWSYMNDDFGNYRADYVAGRFNQNLEKDIIYKFEFFMSKAEKGLLKTNALDLIIAYDTVIDVDNYSAYGYKIWSEIVPMEDTLNWIKVSTCFKAKGNEKTFAIGNFHEKPEVTLAFPLNPSGTGDFDYRYLDNFSLIECPTCCPDQFPNEEQVYVYSNPSSGNDPATLQIWLLPNTTGELKIYDSAGRLVAMENYSDVQNTFIFENLAGGIYHYFFKSSEGVMENGKVLVSGF